MLKKSDIPRPVPENPEIEYYKSLARLAERRARDIRRIAAIDRERIARERGFPTNPLAAEKEQLARTCARLREELQDARAQLDELRQVRDRIARSRAHRLADAYVRHAAGRSLSARILRLFRPVARGLNRVGRAWKAKSD